MSVTSKTSAAKAAGKTADFPFVKRIPFFYGWIMLPIATIAYMMTTPGQTIGISIFNPSLTATLNLTQTQLTGAYALGTFLASLPQSYIGALMDRYGIRRVMIGVVIAIGLACLFMSQVSSLIMLFFAFFFLRLFGQGALSLLSGNTLSMWFINRLGTAQGIYNVGGALSIGLFPPLILYLISTFGWRSAYVLLGIMVCVVMLPILFTIYHDRPEEIGQYPDGEKEVPTAEEAAALSKNDLTLPEAMQSYAYWLYLILMAVVGMIVTAVFFNVIPMFESFGLTAETAALTFTIVAVVSPIFQLSGGVLADYVPVRYITALSMVGFTAAILLLLNTTTPTLAYLYAGLLGLSQGLFTVSQGTMWVRYFGRTNLGKIRGSVMTAAVAGTSLGPFIMGFTYDLLGNYTVSLWIFAAIFAPFTILTLFATPPKTKGISY